MRAPAARRGRGFTAAGAWHSVQVLELTMSPADWGKAGASRDKPSGFVDQAANPILERRAQLPFGEHRRGKVSRHPWLGGTMWGRAFIGLLLLLSLVAGYPYAALILNRAVGTNTVVFGEQDGI